VLSDTLNIPVAPPWIWAGALFGFALALPYRFRLILGFALLSLLVAMAGSLFQAAGYPWPDIFQHLDVLTLVAFVSSALATRLAQLDRSFAVVTRLVGFGVGLLGLLIMSSEADTSLLPAGRRTTEAIYQMVMLITCVTLLILGLRRHWTETVRLAAVALTLFLLMRFSDWFWEALPRYVFFLILAAIALAWLLVLGRIRARLPRVRGLP